MLKWNQIDKNMLMIGKNAIFKHSDNKAEYDIVAKKILGLEIDKKLEDFQFELSVFGLLSECFLAVQFTYHMDYVLEILKSGKAIPIVEAFENEVYKDELLNLFNKENESKPNLTMLKEFIKTKMLNFQILNDSNTTFWIAEWSDVNNWACYWQTGSKFSCLAKMSS